MNSDLIEDAIDAHKLQSTLDSIASKGDLNTELAKVSDVIKAQTQANNNQFKETQDAASKQLALEQSEGYAQDKHETKLEDQNKKLSEKTIKSYEDMAKALQKGNEFSKSLGAVLSEQKENIAKTNDVSALSKALLDFEQQAVKDAKSRSQEDGDKFKQTSLWFKEGRKFQLDNAKAAVKNKLTSMSGKLLSKIGVKSLGKYVTNKADAEEASRKENADSLFAGKKRYTNNEAQHELSKSTNKAKEILSKVNDAVKGKAEVSKTVQNINNTNVKADDTSENDTKVDTLKNEAKDKIKERLKAKVKKQANAKTNKLISKGTKATKSMGKNIGKSLGKLGGRLGSMGIMAGKAALIVGVAVAGFALGQAVYNKLLSGTVEKIGDDVVKYKTEKINADVKANNLENLKDATSHNVSIKQVSAKRAKGEILNKKELAYMRRKAERLNRAKYINAPENQGFFGGFSDSEKIMLTKMKADEFRKWLSDSGGDKSESGKQYYKSQKHSAKMLTRSNNRAKAKAEAKAKAANQKNTEINNDTLVINKGENAKNNDTDTLVVNKGENAKNNVNAVSVSATATPIQKVDQSTVINNNKKAADDALKNLAASVSGQIKNQEQQTAAIQKLAAKPPVAVKYLMPTQHENSIMTKI